MSEQESKEFEFDFEEMCRKVSELRSMALLCDLLWQQIQDGEVKSSDDVYHCLDAMRTRLPALSDDFRECLSWIFERTPLIAE